MWFRKRQKRAATTKSLPIEYSPLFSKNIRLNTIQKVNMAYWSHPGMVRKVNEDSFLFMEEILFSHNRPMYFCLAAVADGMGGLDLGEEASARALQQLRDLIHQRLVPHLSNDKRTTASNIKGILISAVEKINTSLHEDFRNRQVQSGATLSALLLLENAYYFVHIGDSRIYLLDQNQSQIRQLTNDHSYVGRLLAIGEITEEEARHSPRKSEIYKMIAVEREVDPDFVGIELQPHQYVLLCTDGLTDLVSASEILQVVRDSSSIEDATLQLGKLANRRGGYDNCTLLLLQPNWNLEE